MPPWYRVFGTSDSHPEPAAILGALRALGVEVTGQFRGDEQGWFHATSFKGNQGVRVRRATLLGVLVIGLTGIRTRSRIPLKFSMPIAVII